jgi:hypothetical protein
MAEIVGERIPYSDWLMRNYAPVGSRVTVTRKRDCGVEGQVVAWVKPPYGGPTMLEVRTDDNRQLRVHPTGVERLG